MVTMDELRKAQKEKEIQQVFVKSVRRKRTTPTSTKKVAPPSTVAPSTNIYALLTDEQKLILISLRLCFERNLGKPVSLGNINGDITRAGGKSISKKDIQAALDVLASHGICKQLQSFTDGYYNWTYLLIEGEKK